MEVSHKSFVFTSSTFSLWGESRTKASLSHLQLSLVEGSLARKLRFHIFNLWREIKSRTKASFSHLQLSLFEGRLARDASLRDSGCTKCCVLQVKTCLGRWMGKLVRAAVARRSRRWSWSFSDRRRTSWQFRLHLDNFKLLVFEGSLAQKLRFHIFNFPIALVRLNLKYQG